MSTNKITGEITLNEPKLLCMSLPYTKGWTCYVNGEKTETLKANVMLTGVALEAGTHKIELIYNTPYLDIGALISLAGVLSTIGIYVVYYSQKKKKTT